MKVWYNTPNFQSWLTPFILQAKESDKIELDNIGDIGKIKTEDRRPDYFIFDPAPIPSNKYWTDLKNYIKEYATTKFLITSLNNSSREGIKKSGLESFDNVEIMDLESGGKQVNDILFGAGAFD